MLEALTPALTLTIWVYRPSSLRLHLIPSFLPPFVPLIVNTIEHDQMLEALKVRVSSCHVATLCVYLLHTGNKHDIREPKS